MSGIPNERNQNSEGDPAASGKSSDQDGQSLEAQLNAMSARFEDQFNKAFGEIGALKKDKDKAAYRAENLSIENKSAIERLAKHLNISVAQVQEAQRQSVLDELVDKAVESRNQNFTETPGRVEGGNIAAELAGIDKVLELPANDSRVTNLKLLYANDKDAYLKAGLALRDQINQQSPPTPAEEILPNGKTTPKPKGDDMDKIRREYEAARDAIAAKGLSHPERVRAMADLKAEYKGKGLPLN
jgi:regulator of replication initiation timing